MSDLPEELASRPTRKPGQEPSAVLTLDAYVRLRDELEELRTTGRFHIAERLKAAREMGDIRENADYDAAKNEQGLMESRIRRLEAMLRDPDIVETPEAAEAVAPGMLVTVLPLDEEDPEEETYLLADSTEEKAARARTITPASPLGRAVLGAREGDEVVYRAPGGDFRYRVVAFEPHRA
ncbi:MAG: transcription elongation factor GreA [Actinobacteria bacterium]|nr:transcription elongation factor GreA [Actinomycetota bacterium]